MGTNKGIAILISLIVVIIQSFMHILKHHTIKY